MTDEVAPIHTPNADCSLYNQADKPELIVALPGFSWHQHRRPLKFSLHVDMNEPRTVKKFNLKWFLKFMSSEIENMTDSEKELTREEVRQNIRARISKYKTSLGFDISLDEYNEGRGSDAIKVLTPQIILTRGSSLWSVVCRVGEKREKVTVNTKLRWINSEKREQLKKSVIKGIVAREPETEKQVRIIIEDCVDGFKQKHKLNDERRKLAAPRKINVPITTVKIPPVIITGPYFDFEEGRNIQVEYRINQEGKKDEFFFFKVSRSLGVLENDLNSSQMAMAHTIKCTRIFGKEVSVKLKKMLEEKEYSDDYIFPCKINPSLKGTKLTDPSDIANFEEFSNNLLSLPAYKKIVSSRG